MITDIKNKEFEMIKILFCGINGRMGKVTEELIASDAAYKDKLVLSGGVDISDAGEHTFPVYRSIFDCADKPDVIIDFSHHSAVKDICTYAAENGVPAVICTTGHDDAEKELMKDASKKVPIFYSRNMSLGINLLMQLTKKAAQMLGDSFDIEIVEAHHNKKLDAPSGTALMLADAASQGLDYDPEYVYERQSVRKARDKNEIGIHSIRGGNIVGEHRVIFAGSNEVITLSHSAASRSVFASGALKAAEFIADKPAGLYDMGDVVNGI